MVDVCRHFDGTLPPFSGLMSRQSRQATSFVLLGCLAYSSVLMMVTVISIEIVIGIHSVTSHVNLKHDLNETLIASSCLLRQSHGQMQCFKSSGPSSRRVGWLQDLFPLTYQNIEFLVRHLLPL